MLAKNFFIFLAVLIMAGHFQAPLPATAAANEAAKDPLYDELEGADLVAALVRDGKLDSARAALNSISRAELASRSGYIARLRADLELASGKPAEAIAHYRASLLSLKAPGLRQESELGLAKAYQRMGNYTECAQAAGRSADLVFRSEADVLLRAGCERAAKKEVSAWETLAKARKLLPGFSLLQEEIKLLLSLGLREEAFTKSWQHLLGHSASADAIALAEALIENGAKREALLLLELARLRFPMDQDILLAIAPLYFAQGLKRATSDAFSQVAVRNPTYSEHAAETLRQSGSRQRSRYFNLFIPGEKEQGRQKLALAVESSRWDLVAAMDGVIKRTGLEGDDEVNYALAYSLLRGGDMDRSRAYLEKVKAPSLLSKATALFKSLEECAKKGWRCL